MKNVFNLSFRFLTFYYSRKISDNYIPVWANFALDKYRKNTKVIK